MWQGRGGIPAFDLSGRPPAVVGRNDLFASLYAGISEVGVLCVLLCLRYSFFLRAVCFTHSHPLDVWDTAR